MPSCQHPVRPSVPKNRKRIPFFSRWFFTEETALLIRVPNYAIMWNDFPSLLVTTDRSPLTEGGTLPDQTIRNDQDVNAGQIGFAGFDR